MKIYLDNMVVCKNIKPDLVLQDEQKALDKLRKTPLLEIVTSRESWREQEKTRYQAIRDQYQQNRDKIPIVLDDHKVLDFSSQHDQSGGFITSPLVTDIVDEKIFNASKELLKKKTKNVENDARHLMYALCNNCERLVTTDSNFIDNRNEIEKRFSAIQIVKPSELLEELNKNDDKD